MKRKHYAFKVGDRVKAMHKFGGRIDRRIYADSTGGTYIVHLDEYMPSPMHDGMEVARGMYHATFISLDN